MNEKDLRVVKTRDCIHSAFIELLAEKPLGRITVTELARRARIAKGTFYLHYQDIYDLHEQVVLQAFENAVASVGRISVVFHDAHRFVNDYQHAMDHVDAETKLVVRTVDPWQYQRQLVGMLIDRVYDEAEVARSTDADVRLFALFSSFLSLMPVYQITERDALARAIGNVATALFPEVQTSTGTQ